MMAFILSKGEFHDWVLVGGARVLVPLIIPDPMAASCPSSWTALNSNSGLNETHCFNDMHEMRRWNRWLFSVKVGQNLAAVLIHNV